MPIVTVLLIRKMDTANNMTIMPMDTYATNALMPLKVAAVISDLLILRISGTDSK